MPEGVQHAAPDWRVQAGDILLGTSALSETPAAVLATGHPYLRSILMGERTSGCNVCPAHRDGGLVLVGPGLIVRCQHLA